MRGPVVIAAAAAVLAACGPMPADNATRPHKGLFAGPAVEVRTSHDDGACRRTDADLYELTPGGRVLRAAHIPVLRNNLFSPHRTAPLAYYTAHLIPERPGRSFKAHYHGTANGNVTYAAGPDGLWTVRGGAGPPGC